MKENGNATGSQTEKIQKRNYIITFNWGDYASNLGGPVHVPTIYEYPTIT